VEVAGGVLTAPRIGIATGSLQVVPPVDGIDDVPWIDHVGALELGQVPASLAVLGAGPVGLELAQVFSRFGSAVTLVQRPDRIADRLDHDLSAALQDSLEAEGIVVCVGTTATRARRVDEGVELTLAPRAGDGAVATIVVETVLVASGRRPNVDGLGLEAAGVAHGPRGIEVDGHMRTSVEGVWAVGDVTATLQLTPVGDYQARIAVEDMFAGPSREARYDLVPTAIFTDPELASVGLSETAAREAGIDVNTATTPLGNIMRPTYTTPEGERAHGVLKLVYERGSRRLLGVHAVSPAAGDLIQGYAVALAAGARLDDLALGHYAFPTFAEGLHYAALAAYECETGLRAGTPDDGPPASTRMAP
jgi:mercuric reductase